MAAELLTRMEGRTLVLAISNPEQRNALDPSMYAAGVEALDSAGSNRDVGCVLITGEGSTFCAGGNLRRLLANHTQPPGVQAQAIENLGNWVEAIRTCPKPVVAAVEGAAAGAGFSLALACDLIVAARDSIFVMAYANVALSPDGGASWFLSRALPRQLATELLLAGNRINAVRLHELGLVNRVCESGTATRTALDWCAELAARAPNASASIKELITGAAGNSLSEQLVLEREHFVANLHHPSAAAAIGAFLEKKKPGYP